MYVPRCRLSAACGSALDAQPASKLPLRQSKSQPRPALRVGGRVTAVEPAAGLRSRSTAGSARTAPRSWTRTTRSRSASVVAPWSRPTVQMLVVERSLVRVSRTTGPRRSPSQSGFGVRDLRVKDSLTRIAATCPPRHPVCHRPARREAGRPRFATTLGPFLNHPTLADPGPVCWVLPGSMAGGMTPSRNLSAPAGGNSFLATPRCCRAAGGLATAARRPKARARRRALARPREAARPARRAPSCTRGVLVRTISPDK